MGGCVAGPIRCSAVVSQDLERGGDGCTGGAIVLRLAVDSAGDGATRSSSLTRAPSWGRRCSGERPFQWFHFISFLFYFMLTFIYF